MCGIAGFADETITLEDGLRLLNKMLEATAHRGPDARGSFVDFPVFLGHNRLSIIDLSEEANQPFHYRDVSIVYNGEVYNYVELREELKKYGFEFKTQSDTEVILASYHQWGADCVTKFVGMWSFVIYDHRKKILFASRDRFGIKPFYYLHSGKQFFFGSEYKTLKASPLFSNDINTCQVMRGLQLGWISYHDETYFSKLKALPAAHHLTFEIETGNLSVTPYWDMETGRYSHLSFEEKREKFLELFTESVSIHLRSDVQVASCLSGGLDSSAIVSMVQKLHPDREYHAFSVYYEGEGDVDERPFIREVINQYPAVIPHYFTPSQNEIEEHFHHALFYADVPCTGSSFISQYFLMKLIGEHKIKVVLDGQGSDEYLAGYMHTHYRIAADYLRALKFGKALSHTASVGRSLNLTTSQQIIHFSKSILSVFNDEQSLYGIEFRNYFPFMCNERCTPSPFLLKYVKGNRVDNFLYHLMFKTSLPSLLHFEDRNSMAFSVESRVPFLDHRLVEFAFRLRTEEKMNGTVSKYIMRKALSGILPKAIEERKDKKGFVTPGEVKWLRGPLKHLLETGFEHAGFIDKPKADKIIARFRKGDNKHAALVWRLATLNYFLKNFC
ncbi:MAG: asparagine synthase (glutamine-hydrolyzing) [Bacteroidia bacterium]|nr:asparagine synthase (glutamine-hydrolyzing) [Bacteroidia bacterium]